MRLQHIVAAAVWIGGATVLVQCGSSPATPTGNPTPGGVTPSATPAPTPTPSGSSGLPAGMVCSSPTPPPLLRMHVKVHDDSGGRKVLDSKPIVANVDHYCDKVGFGDWKFCDTARGAPRAGGLRLPRHRQGGGHGPLGADLVLRERPLRLLPRQLRQPRDRAVHGGRQDRAARSRPARPTAGRWPRTARAAGPSSSSSGPARRSAAEQPGQDGLRPRALATLLGGHAPQGLLHAARRQPAHVGFPHCVQRTWWHISSRPPP